jgi:hypothetical protein
MHDTLLAALVSAESAKDVISEDGKLNLEDL